MPDDHTSKRNVITSLDKMLYTATIVGLLVALAAAQLLSLPELNRELSKAGPNPIYAGQDKESRVVVTRSRPVLLQVRQRVRHRRSFLLAIVLVAALALVAILLGRKEWLVSWIAGPLVLGIHGVGVLLFGWDAYVARTHTILDFAVICSLLPVFLALFHLSTRYDILPGAGT